MAATGVVVVDVREGHGGRHLVVPVPLALAQIAASFVPEEKTRLHMGREAEWYLPVAREVLAALAQAQDGELVRVEEPGQKVSIRKEGGLLRIVFDEGDRTSTSRCRRAALSGARAAHGSGLAGRLGAPAGTPDRVVASRA